MLAVIFLDAEYATRAHAAVTAAAGNPAAELLLGLLAFIRTAHYWTETHPDLPLEPDAIAFLDQHPQLARLLTDPADAVAAGPRAAWHAAADDLAARETLAAREQRYRALFESMDAGFNLVQAIPGNGRSRYRVAESNPAQARLTGQPDAAGPGPGPDPRRRRRTHLLPGACRGDRGPGPTPDPGVVPGLHQDGIPSQCQRPEVTSARSRPRAGLDESRRFAKCCFPGQITVQTPPDSWRLFAEWLPILAPRDGKIVKCSSTRTNG